MSEDVALLIMTDGRASLLSQTLLSFRDQVGFDNVSCVFVNDDSADVAYHEWLTDYVWSVVRKQPILHRSVLNRSGFGGAIRGAWDWVARARPTFGFDWVFHLEDDFTFNRPVDLALMVGLLIDYPYLAQLALKRQPWGSDIEFANGFMEAKPEWYEQHEDAGVYWVETRRNWTTNPALFRAEMLDVGWPEDPFSEGKFAFVLKERGLPWSGGDCHLSGGDVWEHVLDRVCGHEVQFGILGRIEDPPLVHHIGDYRVGTLY